MILLSYEMISESEIEAKVDLLTHPQRKRQNEEKVNRKLLCGGFFAVGNTSDKNQKSCGVDHK